VFHVLLDTCIWLKLAEDHRHTPLLQVVNGAVDFEWGMINGKLSAIRWMLGEEWDMLDT